MQTARPARHARIDNARTSEQVFSGNKRLWTPLSFPVTKVYVKFRYGHPNRGSRYTLIGKCDFRPMSHKLSDTIHGRDSYMKRKSCGLTLSSGNKVFTLCGPSAKVGLLACSFWYRAFSLPGQFAPQSESANRTLADSLPGQLAPWPFRSLASLLG